MNKYIVGSAVLVTLLGIYVKQGDALNCWDCNSALDPRCADPMDDYTLASVDCNQLELGYEAGANVVPFCRKVVQLIEEHTRVVRGCGWLNETRTDCYSRTGTKDIMITFCHCNTDNCNGSASVMASLGLSAILLLAVKLF